MLGILVQNQRNKQAAKRLLRRARLVVHGRQHESCEGVLALVTLARGLAKAEVFRLRGGNLP